MASMAERETIISFNAADSLINIWSCDPSWMSKIKKLPGAHESHQYGWEVDVPKAWLKINKPPERKPMSVGQKKKAAQILAKARASKKKG